MAKAGARDPDFGPLSEDQAISAKPRELAAFQSTALEKPVNSGEPNIH